MKVVVVGAGGGIGQPLSLLLKLSPLVDELSLYDLFGAPGVAADLSHISTPAKISGFPPGDDKKGLSKALAGANLVIIPAGFPRKPGMTRADLFQKNADVVRDIITEIANTAPDAFILVISNPVNSTVPISAEVLKSKGVFNPKKLFGVTTLDVVRAETFLTEETSAKNINVPVIGGHSGDTIVPLFSQTVPAVSFDESKRDALIKRIQFGGDEVVKAKDGAGSATLSMAQAGFRFAEAVIRAAKGEKNVIEPSFVYVKGLPGGDAISAVTKTDFFSLPIRLGPNGVEEIINVLPKVNEHEKSLLEKAYAGLQGSINEAYEYGKTNIPKQNLPAGKL